MDTVYTLIDATNQTPEISPARFVRTEQSGKMNLDIQFSDWREVNTKKGPRRVRSGAVTDSFWSLWRTVSAELKAAGYSVGKDLRGEWRVSQWAELDPEETARRTAERESSRAAGLDVEIPVPDGLSYLPYQKAGIAYALRREMCLIADEMGLGKTIQAIGVINALPEIQSVIVVCPASLRLNWQREIEKWSVRKFSIGIVNGGRWPAGDPDVIIINYDVLHRHERRLAAMIFDLAIRDEAHYMKNLKAKRTKAGLSIQAVRDLFLSGTPILNKPIEIFPLLTKLDPTDLGKNFFKFARRYCAAHRNRFGWDFSGASNLPELQDKLRERCMIRRLKADVLTELPPKRRQVIEIPADGVRTLINDENFAVEQREALIAEIRVAYELAKASEDDAEYRSALEKLRSETKIAFTAMSAVRASIAVSKVPYVVEHLRDCLEAGQVVCFAHHRAVIAAIAAEFPDDVVTITGDTKMEDRQFAVDEFQAGRKRLFVGNIQAAGVGLTLTASSHVVFAELDWVPANLQQAEDRCHRIGQRGSVLVQHIMFAGSIDAHMAKAIVAKQNVIDAALDDERPAVAAASVAEPTKREPAATEDISRTKIIAAAKKITEEQNIAIHAALRILSGMCDGAHELDGSGFNKLDTAIGKSLAASPVLTARQAVLGLKIIRKYHRQIPDEILETARGNGDENGNKRKKGTGKRRSTRNISGLEISGAGEGGGETTA